MASQRFLPSEFGVEEDRITTLPPFEAFLDKKRKIRRVIEVAGIPHTLVSSNCCGSYLVNILLHPHEKGDDITVYGSGELSFTWIHFLQFSLLNSQTRDSNMYSLNACWRNLCALIYLFEIFVVIFSGGKLWRGYRNVHNQSG